MTKIHCFYCKRFENKDAPAHVTIHDKRGCLHVCHKHASWRLTTSCVFGHSPDCAVAQALEKVESGGAA